MNTVFKVGYQAWLLLGARRRAARCRGPAPGCRARLAGWAGGSRCDPARCSALVVSRTRATYARKDGFASVAVRSTAWAGCGRPRPGDPGAIDWLRANAPGDAVVLEAVGDDYSAVRPRAHLDVHRPADRDRLGRPRGPVGARPGRRACSRTSRRSTRRPIRRPRGR